ncbi:MAG: glycosyltransferase family A protein, partial [Oscillospiraceae bacterium]
MNLLYFNISNCADPNVAKADILVFSPKLCAEDEQKLIAAFEHGLHFLVLRQRPDECAGYYDPLTLDISYAQNDSFAIDKSLFMQLGGLDVRFGSAAACDLLCRAKLAGFSPKYAPTISVLSSGSTVSFSKRAVDTLLLRARYSRAKGVLDGIKCFLKVIKHPDLYSSKASAAIGYFLSRIPSLLAVLFTRKSAYRSVCPDFHAEKFWFSRGVISAKSPNEFPLVSLIMRTRNRPLVCERCLDSLRNQTYRNFEVVVVEDGDPLCERMIRENFSDLKITYKATVHNLGRGGALNLGLSLCAGSFINIIDDDDFLMPEHLELALGTLCECGREMVFCDSIALHADGRKQLMSFPNIDPYEMARTCVTASCGVLFSRKLYDELGGTQSELLADEDWYLWLKYMTADSFTVLKYATSAFTVLDVEAEQKRLTSYAGYYDMLLDNPLLSYSVTRSVLNGWLRQTQNGFDYLKTIGQFEPHLLREAAKITDPDKAQRVYSSLLAQGDTDETFTVTMRQLKEFYDGFVLSLASAK